MGKKKEQTIYVKNMVCDRCIRVVREELQNLGLDVRSVELGEVVIGGALSQPRMTEVQDVLRKNGFELIEDRNAKIIDAVKRAVIELVHHNHETLTLKMKYSEYLAKKVGKDYHSLSVLFSAVENVTIEQYIIRQKIERVKELIKYDERSMSEISYMMNYSSVQHLSAQFKSVTGFTPSEFKNLAPSHKHHHHRTPIDRVK